MGVCAMAGADDLGKELGERREQIAERLDRLHEREEEVREGGPGAVTAETVQHAGEEAETGQQYAARAHERTGDRHAAAAEVHERAAQGDGGAWSPGEGRRGA